MKYTKARAEVVMFDNSDVITTSPGGIGENTGCEGKPQGSNGCPGGYKQETNSIETAGWMN